MKLWCEPCGTTHVFSPREVERIVYALLGDDLDTRWMTQLREPEEWCLRDLVTASHDTEGYRAWVDAAVAARAHQRREPIAAMRRFLAGHARTAAVAVLTAAATAAVVSLRLASATDPVVHALTPNSVGVIDPASNTLVASVAVGKQPTRLAARADSVWVVNAGDSTVSRIDGEEALVTRTFAAPAGAVAAGAGSIWTLDELGRLARIDPEYDTVSRVRQFDQCKLGPYGTPALAVGAGGVWVGGRGSVLAVTADRPGRATAMTTDAETQDIAIGKDAVWVLIRPSYRGHVAPVLRLDRETGATLASVPVGEDPSAIALGPGSVWATAAGSRTLLRLDRDSGRVTAAIRVGDAPSDVAVGAGAVWVANSGDRTVSRIDPRSNRVVATIPLGERPDGIAVAAGRVWVSVY